MSGEVGEEPAPGELLLDFVLSPPWECRRQDQLYKAIQRSSHLQRSSSPSLPPPTSLAGASSSSPSGLSSSSASPSGGEQLPSSDCHYLAQRCKPGRNEGCVRRSRWASVGS